MNHKKKLIAVFVGIAALMLGMSQPAQALNKSAQANIYRHEPGGIQFVLPKGWTAEPDGDILTVSSADGEVAVMFWVSSESDFAAAIEAVADELDNVIKNPKFTREGVEGTHNGMKTFQLTGTGESDGAQVLWDLSVVAAKKPVFVVSVASPQHLQKHAAAYKALVGSIKRL